MRCWGCFGLAVAIFLTACATTKVDWQTRVGSYTFDQAVLELGPPDKDATLTDGTRVAEWLTSRGRHTSSYVRGYRGGSFIDHADGPDYFLRLIFDPTGKLQGFKKYAK